MKLNRVENFKLLDKDQDRYLIKWIGYKKRGLAWVDKSTYKFLKQLKTPIRAYYIANSVYRAKVYVKLTEDGKIELPKSFYSEEEMAKIWGKKMCKWKSFPKLPSHLRKQFFRVKS